MILRNSERRDDFIFSISSRINWCTSALAAADEFDVRLGCDWAAIGWWVGGESFLCGSVDDWTGAGRF